MTTLGMVLSGGAARGAYEAGVLRYLLADLPRRLGRVPWPDVVSGTSVGALNGVFAVAREGQRLHRMSRIWQDLRIEQVYRLRPAKVLGGLLARRHKPEFGLLDPSPLHDLVQREFPAAAMRRSIDSGACRAFIVAATELATGYNAVFVDSASGGLVEQQPGSRSYETRITDAHCRASAAIPFVFPPVRVDGRYLVDGGLRQNTPLRPVLRAGADKVVVIGLKQPRELEGAVPLDDPSPNLMFLAGKTLNALLLDPVERDLWQADQINKLVDWGVKTYGPAFAERLAADLQLRRVDLLFIRPTEDLGRMAGEIYRKSPPRVDRATRALLDLVADRANGSEADLLSYLYFDRAFTAELEALGFEDARRHEESFGRLLEEPLAEVG